MISNWQKSAYGFDYNSPELINSFLSCRKLMTQIGFLLQPDLFTCLLFIIPHDYIKEYQRNIKKYQSSCLKRS